MIYGIKSACPPPVIFFANRESFPVVSKFYKRAFACHDASIPTPVFAQAWFDFYWDILYLADDLFAFKHGFEPRTPWKSSSTACAINDIDRKDISRVKNLALNVDVDRTNSDEDDEA